MADRSKRSERAVFRSVLGRRIFVLFIACALLPIVALSVVSYVFVSRQLADGSRYRLHETARSVAFDIMGRIEMVAAELRMTAAAVESGVEIAGSPHWASLSNHLGDRLRGLAIVDRGGAFDPMIGEVAFPRPASEAAREHLARGEPLLQAQRDAAGKLSVTLSLAIDPADPGRGLLVGEINPEFLWGIRQNTSLPTGTELCVFDEQREPLFSTRRGVEHPMRIALLAARGTTSGEFSWDDEGDRQQARFWTLFLKPTYGAPGWTIIVSVARRDVFAPLGRFSRSLPSIVVLCLAVVALLSVRQIRNSLKPLDALQRGTERLAKQEFDRHVTVTSGDEFEQLAESFNGMADQLGRQLRTLTTLSKIDRAILATGSEEQMISAALQRMPLHFPCQWAAIAVIDPSQPHLATIYSRGASEADSDHVEAAELSFDDLRTLELGRERGLIASGREIPEFLQSLRRAGMNGCRIVSISMRDEICGCLVLAGRDAPRLDADRLEDARRLADQVAIALSNARLLRDLERVNWETLHALARAVDANSAWTSGHSERVTQMAVQLGRALGLDETDLGTLHRGGLLHDIGKIGVPASILDKPGKLTSEELAVMMSHVTIGARILEPISAYAEALPIVLHHHERWNGDGYPDGLAGEEIPRLARVLAVADVFDAVYSDRPYRKAWPFEEVVEYIAAGAGREFDPEVVVVFAKLVADGTIRPRARAAADLQLAPLL